MTISISDIADWEANPVTRTIKIKMKTAEADALANSTILETCDKTAMRTAENYGFSQGCAALVDAIDELKEESQ